MAVVWATLVHALVVQQPLEVLPSIDYGAFLGNWAWLDNGTVTAWYGCNQTQPFYTNPNASAQFRNPERLVVNALSGDDDDATGYGTNYRVWQLHYRLLTFRMGAFPTVPLYLWINETAGPTNTTRVLDIWVCDTIVNTSLLMLTNNQLFRRCGRTNVYTVDCFDALFPDLQCLCNTSTPAWVWATETTCASSCGDDACLQARYVYNQTTYPPSKSPTPAPTAAPTVQPTLLDLRNLDCDTVFWNNPTACTAADTPPVDLRNNIICVVNDGTITRSIPMSDSVPKCSCTELAADLTTVVSGGPTFTCVSAIYTPSTTAPTPASAYLPAPNLPTCYTLLDSDANATCVGGVSDWCNTGTFWEVANYTAFDDTSTIPWSYNDTRITASSVGDYLEEAYANLYALRDTGACMCTDVRKVGWTRNVVRVKSTNAPTPTGTTIWPTTSWTSAPTLPPTASPTFTPTRLPTLSPSSSAPTTLSAYPLPMYSDACSSDDSDYKLVSGYPFTVICRNDTLYEECDKTIVTSGPVPASLGFGYNTAGCGRTATQGFNHSDYVPLGNFKCYNAYTQTGVTGDYGVCLDVNTGIILVEYCYVSAVAGYAGCANVIPCEDNATTHFYSNGGIINTSTDAVGCWAVSPPPPTPQPTLVPSNTPTSTTTSSSPTSQSPTTAPTPYVALWHNLNLTLREFYNADDKNVWFLWMYRPRGPWLVVDPVDDAISVHPDFESDEYDIFQPSVSRCNTDASCEVVSTFQLEYASLSSCVFVCVMLNSVRETDAPLSVSGPPADNLTATCGDPNTVIMNAMIVTPFFSSFQFPSEVFALFYHNSTAAELQLYATWYDMDQDWRTDNTLEDRTCSVDVRLSCFPSLTYFATFDEWVDTLGDNERRFLQSFGDNDALSSSTNHLYPNFTLWNNNTWYYVFPTDAHSTFQRRWSFYAMYQYGVAYSNFRPRGTCPNLTQTPLYGVEIHVGSDDSGPIIATQSYLTPVMDGVFVTNTTCTGICGGPFGTHHAQCTTITDAVACNSTPLCFLCPTPTTTSAPVTEPPASLPPTPVLPSTQSNFATGPTIGILAVLITVAIVTLLVVVGIYYCPAHRDRLGRPRRPKKTRSRRDGSDEQLLGPMRA